jgi:GNAT superfamily N-acetyltransferase
MREKGACGTLKRIAGFAFLAVMLWALACPALPAGAAEPGRGTYFKYDYLQKVDQGKDEYEGWTDETKGTGHYEVLQWGPEEVVMRTRQSWSYRNDDGKTDSGGMDRQFSFSLTTRHYTSAKTDLDDPPYTSLEPSSLAQWLWVPPDVRVGESIEMLDENWTVTGTDVGLWSKWLPRRLIEVTSSGEDDRDDDYGEFTYTYKDRLYFDKVTGMFFAERYEEFDTGTFEGASAGFRYSIEIDVTESSYPVEVDWLSFTAAYGGMILLTALVVGGSFYLYRRKRWGTKTVRLSGPAAAAPVVSYDGTAVQSLPSETVVKISRVWKMRQFPHAPNNATDHFGPLLEHWTQKALLARDPVAVAVSDAGVLEGIAFHNREADIGTVLCKDGRLNESLRGYIGAKDYFTEKRHFLQPGTDEIEDGMPEDEMALQAPPAAVPSGPPTEAYNVFEEHKVYRLDAIPPSGSDQSLVRPMRREDLPAVSALALRVWRTRAKKWVETCFESGDIGYVAEADGKLVGFGFACISGASGRLHTLAVDESYRLRGIGKQLHRARLEALRLLGATTVIDEIADWNLASIRISTLSGFCPVGKMYVETIRDERIKKDIVRRW